MLLKHAENMEERVWIQWGWKIVMEMGQTVTILF